ncbi:hypothetical protein QTH90_30215 [Variovorax sp. J2P1-59]|uniref:hypothetical protein n=1 Tax=Variovorax flavidus TaxID=3053501 RepID=UPI0025783446|nr:hypothetical protein [Variovorax sp. J2P1-59]MDM0078716.1 hypothetical protein [Variovorax sp. J2P1-59]
MSLTFASIGLARLANGGAMVVGHSADFEDAVQKNYLAVSFDSLGADILATQGDLIVAALENDPCN